MSPANFGVDLPPDGISLSAFRYPEWQKPLEEATKEPNLSKLREKMHTAETAIFLRVRELNFSSGSQDELEALQKACEELVKIQTQRLKWPNGLTGLSNEK